MNVFGITGLCTSKHGKVYISCILQDQQSCSILSPLPSLLYNTKMERIQPDFPNRKKSRGGKSGESEILTLESQ